VFHSVGSGIGNAEKQTNIYSDSIERFPVFFALLTVIYMYIYMYVYIRQKYKRNALLQFHDKNGYVTVSHSFVMRTLPTFFHTRIIFWIPSTHFFYFSTTIYYPTQFTLFSFKCVSTVSTA
jgi:hypothetical protein